MDNCRRSECRNGGTSPTSDVAMAAEVFVMVIGGTPTAEIVVAELMVVDTVSEDVDAIEIAFPSSVLEW